MGWEYRVSKEIRTVVHKYGYYDPKIIYGIKEVFVDENGDISRVSDITFFYSESVEQLTEEIQNMLLACKKPVIDYNTGEEI